MTRGKEDLLLEESTHVCGKLTQKSQISTLNTLTPGGHLASISHQDVTTESYIRLTRIKRYDCKLEKLLIFLHNSPCQCHRKCVGNEKGNIHADVRVYRVKIFHELKAEL